MRYLAFISLFLVGCGISFETLTLEEEQPQEDSRNPLEFFKAKKVFGDDVANVWGLEKDECKDFKANSEYEGHGTAIEMQWAKTSCDWIGMGIGWNNWLAKDLGGIMEDTDLVMDIRAPKGETTIPIIVFLLEDYSGVMSAAVSGGYCLESYPINEEWQEFRMPMSKFDYVESGVDLTNIKQLIMECQGFGNIVLDNIRIEDRLDRVIENKKQYPPHIVGGEPMQVIFDGKFESVWGEGEFPGRNYRVEDKVLRMNWDVCTDCFYHQMGMSWEGWKNVDYSENYPSLFLKMEISGRNTSNGDVVVIFENYPGANKEIRLSKYTDEQKTGLHSIFIPFHEFSSEPEFWKRIKQLKLATEGDGGINIHRIEIVNDGGKS